MIIRRTRHVLRARPGCAYHSPDGDMRRSEPRPQGTRPPRIRRRSEPQPQGSALRVVFAARPRAPSALRVAFAARWWAPIGTATVAWSPTERLRSRAREDTWSSDDGRRRRSRTSGRREWRARSPWQSPDAARTSRGNPPTPRRIRWLQTDALSAPWRVEIQLVRAERNGRGIRYSRKRSPPCTQRPHRRLRSAIWRPNRGSRAATRKPRGRVPGRTKLVLLV